MSKRPSLSDNLKAFAAEPAPIVAPPPPPAHVIIDRQPEARAHGPGRAESRKGKKLLLTPVDPSIHKKLKLLAVQQDSTMEALVQEALAEYLDRHGGE